MRLFFYSVFVAFLTLCATQAFTACGGLSEDNADNNDGVTQVTSEIPSSNQDPASNPVITPDNDSESDIGMLNQGLYTGPSLKLPLPAGYKWRLNTEAGTGYCGPQCVDSYHTTAYYSIDFGRSVKDNNGVQSDFGAGVVDVLAAARGTLKSVVDVCDQGNPDCNGALPIGRTACSIEIEHGNGYTTKYLHFQMGSMMYKQADGGKGIVVQQGQILGKMGNTGISCGIAHLHFQVTYNGDSKQANAGLSGVMLEGKDFLGGYKYGDFVPSTNGFFYTPNQPYGVNPRVCSNRLTLQNGDYACTRQNAFLTYRQVFSDILVNRLQDDVCYRWEVAVGGGGMSSTEWCSNGAAYGSGYYLGTASRLITPGATQIRYYVRTKNRGASYLPAPLAVVKFTMLDRFSASDSQPAPINNSPAHQSAAKGTNPTFSWGDRGALPVVDHDLYFWYWNGSGWTDLGWIVAWPNTSVTVSGLPASKYILWQVRSCSQAGCSAWSNQTYFYLQP